MPRRQLTWLLDCRYGRVTEVEIPLSQVFCKLDVWLRQSASIYPAETGPSEFRGRKILSWRMYVLRNGFHILARVLCVRGLAGKHHILWRIRSRLFRNRFSAIKIMFSRIQFVSCNISRDRQDARTFASDFALDQKNNYAIASSHVCCNQNKLVAQAPPERFTVSRKMNAFQNLEEAVELN